MFLNTHALLIQGIKICNLERTDYNKKYCIWNEWKDIMNVKAWSYAIIDKNIILIPFKSIKLLLISLYIWHNIWKINLYLLRALVLRQILNFNKLNWIKSFILTRRKWYKCLKSWCSILFLGQKLNSTIFQYYCNITLFFYNRLSKGICIQCNVNYNYPLQLFNFVFLGRLIFTFF